MGYGKHLCNSWSEISHPLLHKMQEYCEKTCSTAEESTPHDPATTEDAPMFMSLAQQYGIVDKMEIR
jgi:hypothetical protein